MAIHWTVYSDGRYVASGTERDGEERGIMQSLLARRLGSFTIRPESSYRITVGSLSASAYGDEFALVSEAMCEDPIVSERAPSRGFLADRVFPRAVADRAREKREVTRQIETLVNSAVIHPDEGRRLLRGLSGGATLPEINPTDLDGACYGPDDHRLMKYRDRVRSWTTWQCSRCGQAYRMSDQQLARFPPGTTDLEQTVRRALG